MITICMPFYNARLTIRTTILSILNQTFKDFKVILLDDGSTDNTIDVIQDLIDERFQVLRNEVNKGLIYSLNHMVTLCETKYIARMDADDMMHPKRLEIQYNFLEANETIDVVDTLMISFDDSFNLNGLVKFKFLESVEIKDTVYATPLSHATIMAKTCWYKNNKYDQEFYRAEDHELFCRTFQTSNFARIYQPLYFVRSHNINIKNYKSAIQTQKKILLKNKLLLTQREYLLALIRIHIKRLAYSLFGFFNYQHHLVYKRNTKLSSRFYSAYSEILRNTCKV